MDIREETQKKWKKMLRKGLCTKINLLWGSKALMIKLRADELRGKNSGL